MDNGRIGELQRIAQLQSVRARQLPLLPTPMTSDGQQQAATGRSPSPHPDAALNAARIAPRDAAATTVELSAAALLSPVFSESAIDAIRDTSARPLATVLVDLTRALHDPSAAADERPAPALKLATRLRMLTEVIATASDAPAQAPTATGIPSLQARVAYQQMQGQPRLADELAAAPVAQPAGEQQALDPRITQVLVGAGLAASQDPRATGVLPQGAAAYLAAPGLVPTFARMDLIEVNPEGATPRRPGVEPTFLATLHLQLPELGQVTATVALTGSRADVSIAGSSAVIAGLRNSEAAARDAAAAWGLRVGSIGFVEFG